MLRLFTRQSGTDLSQQIQPGSGTHQTGGVGTFEAPTNTRKATQFVRGNGSRPTGRRGVRQYVQSLSRRTRSAITLGLATAMIAGTMGCATTQAQQVVRTAPTQTAQTVQVAQLAPEIQEQRAAVLELKALHEKGDLDELFERDPKTGVYVHADKHDVFSRLPVVGPQTTPQEMLDLGLIDAIPPGLDRLDSLPRYFDGKQVFVKTSTNSDKSNWGYFEDGGTSRITHRGEIVGMNGDDFLVEVPKRRGGSEVITVSKAEMLRLNQPSSPASDKSTVNTILLDYTDPIVRANMAQGFFLIADELAKLDFTKPVDDKTNREARLAIVAALFKNQESEYIKTHHADWRKTPSSMANILNEGVDVCTGQGTTQWGYAQPFENIAGFRLLNVAGATIDENNGHNFNILWLTGSEEMFVTDRTWNWTNRHVPIERAMGSEGWNRNRYMVSPNPRAPADLVVSDAQIQVNGN